MSESQLQARSKVPTNLTWDVSAIYPNEEAYLQDIDWVKQQTAEFVNQYQGQLTDNQTIVAALKVFDEINAHFSWIDNYAFLQNAADLTDPKYSQMIREVSQMSADINAKTTFFFTELSQLSNDKLLAVSADSPEFTPFLRHIEAFKKIQLDSAVETTINQLEPVFNAPANVYSQTRAADMDFEPFTVNGKTYPMSFVLYENTYQYNADTAVRRAAFESFSKTLKVYKNTVAATYYAQVSREKTIATMRGFESVVDYLLYDQEVDRSLFNRQIDLIMNELGPVMQRYVALIKSERGLDKMTFADLQIDLDPEYAPKVTVEESKDYIRDAIKLLGKDYETKIMQAYPERWVDFAQNKGKETGGFESSPYRKHPYILMSWTDELADVYTLVHELGHAGQTTRSQAIQPYICCDLPLYLIEAPSTFNELLLTHSIEEKSTDDRMKRFALTKMLTNTYFHNCVTHLLEAAYQREVYRLIDAGQGFDGDKLSEIKRGVLAQFWGPDVEINPGAELTWMRQSHYYMGLYSYTYSASLVVSTQAFKRIMTEGQPAINDWLKFLELGDSMMPVEAAQVAGVDITTDQALKSMIRYLSDTVDQITKLSNQL